MAEHTDFVELTEDVSGSSLYNQDLAPAGIDRRTWNQWHIAALWVGMAVCIPTYMLASSLIQQGMTWWQAIMTIMIGNVIVLIPMMLNAHAGTKYGIPFPVLLRSSFGVLGANIPAMMRALVACGWFGIQTWIGGAAIYQLVTVAGLDLSGLPQLLPEFADIKTGPFLCFMFFWAINMWVIWRGIETIKVLETWAAPFLLLIGLALLGWAVVKAGGFGPIFAQEPLLPEGTSFWSIFFPGLTAMVGFWATLSLNIPDFTRFAKSQRDQMVGQAIGLPLTMTLFSFIGVAVTSATVIIFGESIWDPIVLLARFENPVVVVVAMLALVVATLSTNIAANVVGPANDISNLKPSKISFKMGGYITGIVGILIMPWKLLADPTGYIFTWLIGYSALLGPIAGIMISDYFVVQRMKLAHADLYKHDGKYSYTGGFNLAAIAILIAAVLPNLPGFLTQISVLESAPDIFLSIYPYAWFVGFAIAFGLYSVYGLTRRER
jgi:NCS1 family nucleobase:cation symporter-1